MAANIAIGIQDFATIMENNYFYIDKTSFLKEWWDSGDSVTLITRPRRFGKTLTMSMAEQFFSRKYANRSDLFEKLNIWEEEKYRNLQGTYPVISLSFARIKENSYEKTKQKMCEILRNVYIQFAYIRESDKLTDADRAYYDRMLAEEIKETDATSSLYQLSDFLYRYYGKKVIILLDEYDTPMQEAYIHDYWDKFTSFVRGLFNSTFKTNPYLERALMTGITRISKASIFSDLNNLVVITATSERYAECFGFTEKEVFQALELFDLGEQKSSVKAWYDGFIFGSKKDIYNPWSITNFLKEGRIRSYWAATSSNGLINRMIQTASSEIKTGMETLLNGGQIEACFDEQIVFEQLDRDENAIWSLLLASGYLKADRVEYRGMTMEPWYYLSITNLETASMFSSMFKSWFGITQSSYNGFMKALLSDDIEAMNHYLNEVIMATFSFFDTGSDCSETDEPERFYHGFILGLIVEQWENYRIRSNRESGFGRYDVMMIPRERSGKHLPAIVMEFKVHNSRKEQTLEETVQAALQQIEDKHYDAELLAQGFKKAQIHHYGFAFQGKKVLIAGESGL